MGESVEDYISIMSTMGNIFFLTFAIALASVKSETCTTNSGTACLSSSEVSSGYSWLFSTGSSCFPYGRRNYCFIDQTNYIYSCYYNQLRRYLGIRRWLELLFRGGRRHLHQSNLRPEPRLLSRPGQV